MSDPPVETVLIVEDDPDLRRLYVAWLAERYATRTAATGRQALTELDAEVGVVLLDRTLPDITGGEILAAIRRHEMSCRVAMVTAIEPGFDILDLGFDDYLTKPVRATDLRQVVDQLFTLEDHHDAVKEFYALVSTKAALQTTVPPNRLAANDEYHQLCARVEQAEQRAETHLRELADQNGTAWVFQRALTGDTGP